MPASTLDELARLFAGSQPLIYLRTVEEARAERIIRAALQRVRPGAEPLAWTATRGVSGAGTRVPESEPALKALEFVRTSAGAPVTIFKDLHAAIGGDPAVVRKLRDLYQELKGQRRFVVVLSPVRVIPEELLAEIQYLELDLPDDAELLALYDERAVAAGAPPLDAAARHALAGAMRGLPLHEAEIAVADAADRFARGGELAPVLRAVHAQKEQATRKEGVLDFIPPDAAIESVGGLDTLKDWLAKRAKAVRSPDSKVPLPKGILVMGIAGCGKSLTIKTISASWGLPLFRMDMNRIFGGGAGAPEIAVERALRTLEQLAPAVLWIDEIEMSFAGYAHKEGGAAARIFGNFLTWMQEHKTLVFVAATANRIEMLPAEILRKGRFDQIFFVDLPVEEERREILSIHIRRTGGDPGKFSMASLLKLTKGYSGAEIESCVAAASIDAFAENRPMGDNDLYRAITKTVPLSKTMSEQVKAIRSWARDRATLASKAQNMEV